MLRVLVYVFAGVRAAFWRFWPFLWFNLDYFIRPSYMATFAASTRIWSTKKDMFYGVCVVECVYVWNYGL